MNDRLLSDTYINVFSMTRKLRYSRENRAMPLENFDTYRILQRHRTCVFSVTARLSCWSLSADCSDSSAKK